MHAHAEGFQNRRVQAAVVAGAEGADHDRRRGEQDQHAGHQSQGSRFECTHPSSPLNTARLQFFQPPHGIPRLFQNRFFDSPDSSHIGGPKVMQLKSGTGSNRPRGRMRFMLSMYTGINSRSGRFLLR